MPVFGNIFHQGFGQKIFAHDIGFKRWQERSGAAQCQDKMGVFIGWGIRKISRKCGPIVRFFGSEIVKVQYFLLESCKGQSQFIALQYAFFILGCWSPVHIFFALEHAFKDVFLGQLDDNLFGI